MAFGCAAAGAGATGPAPPPPDANRPVPPRHRTTTQRCWRCSRTGAPSSNRRLRGGAPDYTAATMARKQAELPALQARLAAIDPAAWPIAPAGRLPAGARRDERARLRPARAASRGCAIRPSTSRSGPSRAIPPATRDRRTPRSSSSGPTHFPLDEAREQRLARELAVIPPLLEQARTNLTGNARDLWITGTGTMKIQLADLKALATKTAQVRRRAQDRRWMRRPRRRREFIAWLEPQAPSQDRAVRRRQGQLHLEPAERAPRAPDLGPGSGAAEARAGAGARLARSWRSSATGACRRSRPPPRPRNTRPRGQRRDHEVHGLPEGAGTS